MSENTNEFSARDLKSQTWLYAATLVGEPGRAWAADFRTSPQSEALGSIRDALLSLRRGDMDSGRAQLESCRRVLDDSDPEAVATWVFERFLCGVVAYERFVSDDDGGAMAALARGEACARKAFEEKRFLLTLASTFSEFNVQRARIARLRRDWPSLGRFLNSARSMVASEAPLCTLADGEAIYVSTVANYFDQFSLDAEALEEIAIYLDTRALAQRFERFISNISSPHHFVVPYP
ncbi:MAG: hypothetical protein AAGM22_09240 [Acidobacteriota bacterium]